MERNLIFTHIPKTGGTTFRYLLERQYGTEHTRVLDGDEAAQAFRNQSPEARQPVRLLMGHMFTGLHTALSGPTDYVTFLRHPVQRILSYYAHVHNEKDNPLHEAVTQHQIGLYDFVQQLDWGNINNTQIRFISGIKDTEEAMLAKAMENIERDYPVVGILERFEESLVAMKHHFGWDISHYQVRNKSPKSKKPTTIDARTRDLILERNREDVLLYEAMQEKLDQQLAAMGAATVKAELRQLGQRSKWDVRELARTAMRKWRHYVTRT